MNDQSLGWRSLRPSVPAIILFNLLIVVGLACASLAEAAIQCGRTVRAQVVVFDQPVFFNRLGAQNVNWIMYALRRDVVDLGGTPLTQPGAQVIPGQVEMRPDKRPRPLVLRVREGDCLDIRFQNLLDPVANPFNAAPPIMTIDDQVKGRQAGFHPTGMQLVRQISDDGSFVGENANSLATPGQNKRYVYFAEHEGTYAAYSYGQPFGGEASGGNIGNGMWGVVVVEPKRARIYRGQITEEELRLAADINGDGLLRRVDGEKTADGHPIIDYEATYPNAEPWITEGKAGLPIINMQCQSAVPGLCVKNELVHSDINAIIAGPLANYRFPNNTYPLESKNKRNPSVPNRLEPFREFVSAFHDENATRQAFPLWFGDPVLGHTLHGVRDSFMINYGSGGIGTEIIANRLGVGPMYDCLGCAYEEFFLTAFTVGDPAQLVDVPANVGLEACDPNNIPGTCLDTGRKATEGLFPADPSNVHHSYTGDFTKFRNLHAGPKEQHIFHLHNHQWLFNANDDNSNYLDAQGIGPGSGYTYEISFGGSGNRNKTAGDAIFHCHFYPHFAQGMWYLWRNHDTFEPGTRLAVTNQGQPVVADGGKYHSSPFGLRSGKPAGNARALPDGEVLRGMPIPALVPLPGKAMPPMPGKVEIVQKDADGDGNADSSQINVIDRDINPGYPFWIAGVDCGGPAGLGDPTGCRDGIVGQRPPTPPLDMVDKALVNALKTDPDPAIKSLFANLKPAQADGFDGGLPRHSLDGCKAAEPGTASCFTAVAAPANPADPIYAAAQTRLDFHKDVLKSKAVFFPEEGTDLELLSMEFHAQRCHDTFLPDGSPANCKPNKTGGFVVNGAKPAVGAPFHEPCIDDKGKVFKKGASGNFFSSRPGGFFRASPQFGADNPRIYKAANIQIDAVFNKVGYHYPQQRIIALWQDVLPTINKKRPPEPFVMRMNTYDCAVYHHTNLVPKEFEVDDYQVRTPTDIIGQHIHLPKWDLTTADGAANGWNYEDGTLSPGMVRERIEAINHFNGNNALQAAPHPFFGPGVGGEWVGARTTTQRWFADPVINVDGKDRGLGIIFTHDHYGPSTHQQIGLYATLLIEPAKSKWVHNETGELLYNPKKRIDGGPTSWQAAIHAGKDSFREFYLEFSDFQHAYQPGVYVGAGPKGRPFKGQAGSPSHNARGINKAFPVTANTFRDAINPSFRQQANDPSGTGLTPFPDIVRYPPTCPGGVARPCPEAISADDIGMFVVNYRNEPVGLRVFDPNRIGPDGKPGTQAGGRKGDLSFALQSRRDRAIPELNVQPGAGTTVNGTKFPPPINSGGVQPGDPFTPMMRTYSGDLVKVKIQAGGHEHEHNATIHGVKWLQGGSGYGSAPNSGWRNSQSDGISEQFTFSSPVFAKKGQQGNAADYAWNVSNGQDGWWTGVWGVMRNYATKRANLKTIPSNNVPLKKFVNGGRYDGVCPETAPEREFDVTAVLANDVLPNALGATIIPNDVSARMHVGAKVHPNTGAPVGVNNRNGIAALDPDGGTLVYNPRPQVIKRQTFPAEDGAPALNRPRRDGPLHDPTAILYVRTKDLRPAPGNDCSVKDMDCPVVLRGRRPVEPLVLRAKAGQCIEVTLRNRLPNIVPDLAGFNTLLQVVRRDRDDPQGMTTFQNNLIRPSSHVGIHPQLVEYDVTTSDGVNVGRNPIQTVAPGEKREYRWYAGHLTATKGPNAGRAVLRFDPIELGGFNLSPADRIKQGQKGMIGAGVIVPKGTQIVQRDRTPDGQNPGADNSRTRLTRASATIAKNGVPLFRDFAVMHQKGLNHRFKDGTAIPNIASEGQGIPEDSHDAGQMAINYGTEPLWFRFGLHPDAPFGNAQGPAGGFGAVANVHRAYSNTLVNNVVPGCQANPTLPGCDPWTPVFNAEAGQEVRMRVLQPFGVGRGTTFNMHGHVWQRDPYVCPGSRHNGLAGKCTPKEVGSKAIGDNPVGWYLGAQESVTPMAHFDLVFPSAGGGNGVVGDYLFHDQGSFGNTSGLWGIMRVAAAPAPQEPELTDPEIPVGADSFILQVKDPAADAAADPAAGVNVDIAL